MTAPETAVEINAWHHTYPWNSPCSRFYIFKMNSYQALMCLVKQFSHIYHVDMLHITGCHFYCLPPISPLFHWAFKDQWRQPMSALKALLKRQLCSARDIQNEDNDHSKWHRRAWFSLDERSYLSVKRTSASAPDERRDEIRSGGKKKGSGVEWQHN